MKIKQEESALIREAFIRGILKWMLKPEQKKIYDLIHANPEQKFIINCARRLGKSFLMCVLADEYARQNPESAIKYVAATQKQVRDIVKPLFYKIWKRCPKTLIPKYVYVDSTFLYPNGSRITLAGCDEGRIDKLRGDECNLALIDEAGAIDRGLEYLIKDILIPQTLIVKKNKPIDGKIIITSTPPRNYAHYFVQLCLEAQQSKKGNYVHMTIYDNTFITRKDIIKYAKEAGCVVDEERLEIVKLSTTFRREYLAEIIPEDTLKIIPEFNNEKEQKLVRSDYKIPEHFDAYVALDVGMVDFTAILFGFYDFINGVLVVQDEITLNYKDNFNTEILATLIKQKEKELWGDKRPYLRVMDNDPILNKDLAHLHNLDFVITEKTNKESAVNAVRLMIYNDSIIIDPKCVSLIAHLKNGVWKPNRQEFDRSGEFGHFDCIDALSYMVRNLDRTHNPYPAGYNVELFKRYATNDVFVNNNIINQNNLDRDSKTFIELFSLDKTNTEEDIFLNFFTRKLKGGGNE